MTASPLPRRRLDRHSRRQVIGLLIGLAVVWLVALALAVSGKLPVAAPPKYMSQLRRLKSADPDEDATKEYQNGVFKLYVLEQSDRQKVPGVPNPGDRIQQLGLRVILLPFDATNDKAHEQLQHAAFEYAFKYNVAMLKLIDKQGFPATVAATRPSSSQPAMQTSAEAATRPGSTQR